MAKQISNHSDVQLLSNKKISNLIFLINGQQVILDRDLAILYQTDTRTLKQAVKRNAERFPADFMFELTDKQIETMVSQLVIPSKSYLGGASLKDLGKKWFAFSKMDSFVEDVLSKLKQGGEDE